MPQWAGERSSRFSSLTLSSSEEMRRAFRMQTSRALRHSDGTFTVCGVRFEVPTRYRTLCRLTVRVARWDLSCVDLVDPRTGCPGRGGGLCALDFEATIGHSLMLRIS